MGSGGAAGWRLTARPSPAVDPSAIWAQVRFGMLRRKSEAGEIRCSGRRTSREEDDGRARESLRDPRPVASATERGASVGCQPITNRPSVDLPTEQKN